MNRINYRDEILFQYADLGAGRAKAGEVCPACKGGQAKEGSLSVTRRGNLLLYNCHRASCGFRGAVSTGGIARGDDEAGGTPRRRGPRVKTEEINEATLKLLATKFGISTEVLRNAGLRWSGDGDGYLARRVCFPIYGPDAEERGASYRSYEKGIEPKAVIELYHPDNVCQSWYKWRLRSNYLIVVEDPMSALRLAPHVHSLSLMGVLLSEEKLNEIKAQDYDKVLLCLDGDATREAIKLRLKWGKHLKSLEVYGLGDKDVKNMNEGEFNEFLSKVLL